jgi:hypothetical protein
MGHDEDTILDALRSGNYLLSIHTASRMAQRSVTAADIRPCGLTAGTCIFQAAQGTWRVEGDDLDGKSLTIICGIDEDVIIVTVF